MQTQPRRHFIQHEVAEIAMRSCEAARGALPTEEIIVAGEVIEVRGSGDFWYLVLRDIKEDGRSFSASLPIAETEPRVGFTIALVGHYALEYDEVDASMALVFRASKRDPAWVENKPRKTSDRDEHIRLLDERFPERAEPARPPSRVAVVCGGGVAISDVKRGIWRRHQEKVTLELFRVKMEGPDGIAVATGIAAGVVRAAETNPDLIILTRGGGRAAMLAIFSRAEILDAVAEAGARIPIIVAIGHSTDYVIASRYAWKTASVPNEAGRLVSQAIADFEKRPSPIAVVESVAPRPSIPSPPSASPPAPTSLPKAEWDAPPQRPYDPPTQRPTAMASKGYKRSSGGWLGWLIVAAALWFGARRCVLSNNRSRTDTIDPGGSHRQTSPLTSPPPSPVKPDSEASTRHQRKRVSRRESVPAPSVVPASSDSEQASH